MRILDAATLKETAGRRRTENDMSVSLTHTVNEDFQVARIRIPCTVTGFFLLLVVMAELHDDIVAGFQLCQDFIQSSLRQECSTGKA